MQTKFKRHEKVRLLRDPNPEYVEPYTDKPVKITKGAEGSINVLLQNGKYHVRISDENNDEIAYVVMSEEDLEAI